jgi:hypothetical protein
MVGGWLLNMGAAMLRPYNCCGGTIRFSRKSTGTFRRKGTGTVGRKNTGTVRRKEVRGRPSPESSDVKVRKKNAARIPNELPCRAVIIKQMFYCVKYKFLV